MPIVSGCANVLRSKAIPKMKQAQNGMPPEHAGPGITHDFFHLFPPMALIAVDRTFGAGWFIGFKAAALQASRCIVEKVLALFTECRNALMVGATITMNHDPHGR